MATHTTQEHISIKGIKNDIIQLKNGGAALILQVPAVNFGLLSEREQIGIIFAFAQLVNSLSHTIQIFIFSERLNIASYLALLDQARASQTNPLLLKLMGSYYTFIQSTIKDYEVLDKKFYLVVPLYKEEVGIANSEELLWHKIRTILLPRREQLIRLLGRIGLRAQQLDSKQIIDLFYDIYNGETYTQPSTEPILVSPPQAAPKPAPPPQPIPSQPTTPAPPPQPAPPPPTSNLQPLTSNIQPPISTFEPIKAKTHPFVVEELPS